MSNIIKSSVYTSTKDKHLIEILDIAKPFSDELALKEQEKLQLQSTEEVEAQLGAEQMREQIVKDAEEWAEAQVVQAREQADKLMEEAKTSIDEWWAERRQLDETAAAEAAERGFQQGYQEGNAQAVNQVLTEYESTIEQARNVLELAYKQKEAVLAEAEPFLVELSSAIAGKVIHKQLTLEPEWIIDTVKAVLSRRREQGDITLCVSPGQYAYLCDAKEDLVQTLDSQAELHIVPDATVEDHGCVVRSAFGSMDARVDTQLGEIKQALLHLARRNEESTSDE